MAAPTTETVWWLGETKGFWVQTGAFLLSAIAASVTIFYNAQQVRLLRKQNNQAERQARSRATVDVVLHEKSDAAYQAARKKYGELHDTQANFTSFACGKLTDHPDENAAIMSVLNNYEFIAAGIRSLAFDEEIYRRMKRSLVIRDWETVAPYVAELRRKEKRPKIYAEFEWLAKKWSGEPEPD